MNQIMEDLAFEKMFDVEAEAERSGTGVFEDPQKDWAKLLAMAPVHRGTVAQCMGLPEGQQQLYVPGRTYFSVFSYAGVSSVFTRKEDFDSSFYYDIGMADWLGETIIIMDGLRHRRYRDLVQEHFQPAAASAWWRNDIITGLVDELVGGFDPSASIDLNSQLCARLPMRTVTKAFGLSSEDGFQFRAQMQIANGFYESPERKAAALQAAVEILERVIGQRQAEPRDDVISRLAVAELEEEDGSAGPRETRRCWASRSPRER
jgi:cytochrome P450